MRGYFGIGLVQPKTPVNVGAVLRAAHCFGAAFVAVTGRRYKRAPTDTMNYVAHNPLFTVENILDACPFDCVPIAVDLIEGATALPQFVHPPRAYYIFGPEDGTLGKTVTDRCAATIVIPSKACLNLAMAVNVVAYDRTSKK